MKLLPLVAALAMAARPATAADHAPTGLLTNLLTQPELSILTDPAPDFGWIVPTTRPGDTQSAYQILVASSMEEITADRGDLWDTGKVADSRSINLVYQGKPLAANRSYWWKVRTWNADGQPSAFSAPSQFHLGEINRQDKKWPGESRWVRLPGQSGEKSWTFEDRPPVQFTPRPVVTMEGKPDRTWFLDFGQAAFATLRVTIAWSPSKPETVEHTIQIAVGEKNRGNSVETKPGGGIIYQKMPMKLRPGEHEYTLEVPRFVPRYPHSQAMPEIMPEVIPFRYAEVFPGAESITLKNPTQLALWIPFDDTASRFESSNASLDAVYDLCRYSVKVNTFNGDYAASQRERMMYEADSYIHQMSHYAVDRAFATARYTQENMIYHASWPTEWISHSIFMAWADYWHTGNTRSLQRHYEHLKPKTMLALAGEDGLISTRTGKQSKEFLASIHFHSGKLNDIVDWPKGETDKHDFRDYNTVVNACHYQSLVLMARIAATLGKSDDERVYRRHSEKVAAAIQARMFNPSTGLFIDGIGSTHSSFHSNLFPLAFGLVPESRKETILGFLKSKGMACSVYPTVYLLEALFDAGEDQAALDLMTSDSDRSWLHMLRVGSTVTTEAWDVKYKANIGWTHAWSTAPVQILPRKVLGIEPIEAGFGKVRVFPRPGNLTHASGRLPTIRGFIDASFRRPDDRTFEYTLTLPANVTARVALPSLGSTSTRVSVNGTPVEGRLNGDRIWLPDLGAGTHQIKRVGTVMP